MPRAEPVTIAVRGPSAATAYLLVWKVERAGAVRGSRRGAFVVRDRMTEAIVVKIRYMGCYEVTRTSNNNTLEMA
jgi:hypothetical protein